MKKIFMLFSTLALCLMNSCSSSDLFPDLGSAKRVGTLMENQPYCKDDEYNELFRKANGYDSTSEARMRESYFFC